MEYPKDYINAIKESTQLKQSSDYFLSLWVETGHENILDWIEYLDNKSKYIAQGYQYGK